MFHSSKGGREREKSSREGKSLSHSLNSSQSSSKSPPKPKKSNSTAEIQEAISELEELTKTEDLPYKTPETHYTSLNYHFESSYLGKMIYRGLEAIRGRKNLTLTEINCGLNKDKKKVYLDYEADLSWKTKGAWQINLFIGKQTDIEDNYLGKTLLSLQFYINREENFTDLTIRTHGNNFHIYSSKDLKNLLEKIKTVLKKIAVKPLDFERGELSLQNQEVTIRYPSRFESKIGELLNEKAEPEKGLNRYVLIQRYGEGKLLMFRIPVKVQDTYIWIKTYRKHNFKVPAYHNSDHPKLEIRKSRKRGEAGIEEFSEFYDLGKGIIKGLLLEVEIPPEEILPLSDKYNVNWRFTDKTEPLHLKKGEYEALEYIENPSQNFNSLLETLIVRAKDRKKNQKIKALKGVKHKINKLAKGLPIQLEPLQRRLQKCYKNGNKLAYRFLQTYNVKKVTKKGTYKNTNYLVKDQIPIKILKRYNLRAIYRPSDDYEKRKQKSYLEYVKKFLPPPDS